jgi:hypothetical protein
MHRTFLFVPAQTMIGGLVIGLIAVSLGIAAIYRNWSPLIAPFGSVPLAPLNPTNEDRPGINRTD